MRRSRKENGLTEVGIVYLFPLARRGKAVLRVGWRVYRVVFDCVTLHGGDIILLINILSEQTI